MIRVAACGDVHAGGDSSGQIAAAFAGVDERADLLLLAGDLTRCGTPDEAEVLARELRDVRIPKLAVLGNHDYHDDRPDELAAVLRDGGIAVLEGSHAVVEVDGIRVGVAGSKGFGGGFVGAAGSAFGEPEMKAFIGHTEQVSRRLEAALAALDSDLRIALLHYAPVPDTLEGERREIYPFLGSWLLGQAVDRAGAHLVLHGHAHAGTEHGETPSGTPVRNVAQHVLRAAYRVYVLATDGSLALHRSELPLVQH